MELRQKWTCLLKDDVYCEIFILVSGSEDVQGHII